MKKICVVTATRAEYGILRNTIKRIKEDPGLELCLVVTGAHLVHTLGYTIKEIEEDGIPIAEKVDILMADDSEAAISKTMGVASLLFSDLFDRQKPDLLLVLGDRYELMPICCCAVNARIPIAHISGGETTEGAIDESIRHCITKMSWLHFPACEEYRHRIIQLGEVPDRVFNFGDVGVETIQKMSFMSKPELEASLSCRLDPPYMGVTFHPVTLSEESVDSQLEEVFKAIEVLTELKFVFTKSNADAGGRRMNQMLESYVRTHENGILFDSLGNSRYLAMLKYSCGIVGNSSSGIVEAPSLRIPTVNIGDRQRGRLQADSIINCRTEKDDIIRAIQLARTPAFIEKIKSTVNPYSGGDTSERIVTKIKEMLSSPIDLKKKFYDINF